MQSIDACWKLAVRVACPSKMSLLVLSKLKRNIHELIIRKEMSYIRGVGEEGVMQVHTYAQMCRSSIYAVDACSRRIFATAF